MPTNNRSDPLNLRFRDAFSPKPDGNEPTGLPTRLVGHGGRIARREKNARRFSRRLPFNELEQHDRALLVKALAGALRRWGPKRSERERGGDIRTAMHVCLLSGS